MNNVVNSVARAKMLLNEIDSPWLKVVIDPANLLRAGDFPRLSEVLDEAFDWLGQDIVLAHAKNPETGRDPDETVPVEVSPEIGGGLVPGLEEFWQAHQELIARGIPRQLLDQKEFYSQYVQRLKAIGFTGALVMHGMTEDDVATTQLLIGAALGHSKRFG